MSYGDVYSVTRYDAPPAVIEHMFHLDTAWLMILETGCIASTFTALRGLAMPDLSSGYADLIIVMWACKRGLAVAKLDGTITRGRHNRIVSNNGIVPHRAGEIFD